MEALSKCTHYGRCPFLQERFGPSFNKFRIREQSLGIVVVEERDKGLDKPHTAPSILLLEDHYLQDVRFGHARIKEAPSLGWQSRNFAPRTKRNSLDHTKYTAPTHSKIEDRNQ